MVTQFKTLPFFRKSSTDVYFEIHDVLQNTAHPQHQAVLKDIDSIGPTELSVFVDAHHINSMIGRQENKEQARRVFFLTYAIQRQIAENIVEELCSHADRPRPYDSTNLSEVPLDAHHLISTEIFTESSGLIYNGIAYELCPVTAGSNSSYWLYSAIVSIAAEKGIDFRIRLHPYMEFPVAEYHPMHYKMTVHGRPLDWNRLRTLKQDEFGQWMNEKEYDDHLFTDYVWSPKGSEIHFTCEELVRPQALRTRGNRYFHAIFDQHSGQITHCDGAIRVYTPEQLQYRSQFHLRQPEVRKMGRRIKIFQIDKTAIDQQDFMLLVTSFFVWNDDVQGYFNPIIPAF